MKGGDMSRIIKGTLKTECGDVSVFYTLTNGWRVDSGFVKEVNLETLTEAQRLAANYPNISNVRVE